MGGTDDEVDALVARALSTSLGSQVPQMEPKSKEPEELLLTTTLTSCRMEAENALKQHGQRGLLLGVVVLPTMMLKIEEEVESIIPPQTYYFVSSGEIRNVPNYYLLDTITQRCIGFAIERARFSR